jgi:predicted phosphodiesterase
LEQCARQKFDIVVMGHTHYPMQNKIGRTLLINPGAVGQPRNYNPGAHWALCDTALGEVSFHCEPYDTRVVIAEARRRHPEIAYLSEVLVRS